MNRMADFSHRGKDRRRQLNRKGTYISRLIRLRY
jgi:hypothetical protein